MLTQNSIFKTPSLTSRITQIHLKTKQNCGDPPWKVNSWVFTSPSSIITGSTKWGPGTFQHFRWSWTCTDFFLATSPSAVRSTSTVHCLMGGIWAFMAATVLRVPGTNNPLVPRISSCLGPSSPQVAVSGFSKLLERAHLGHLRCQAVAQGNPLFGQLLQGVPLQRVLSNAPRQTDLWLSMNMWGQHTPSNPLCSVVSAACLKLGQFLEHLLCKLFSAARLQFLTHPSFKRSAPTLFSLTCKLSY